MEIQSHPRHRAKDPLHNVLSDGDGSESVSRSILLSRGRGGSGGVGACRRAVGTACGHRTGGGDEVKQLMNWQVVLVRD